MKDFKVKSLTPGVPDEYLKKEFSTVSFCSFERAIRETNELAGITRPVAGYVITEQGINIYWTK